MPRGLYFMDLLHPLCLLITFSYLPPPPPLLFSLLRLLLHRLLHDHQKGSGDDDDDNDCHDYDILTSLDPEYSSHLYSGHLFIFSQWDDERSPL